MNSRKGLPYKYFASKYNCLLQKWDAPLINQYVWAREEKNLGIAKQRKKRETEEKESQRWLESVSETQQQIPEDIQVVTIGDCEADIFDSPIQK